MPAVTPFLPFELDVVFLGGVLFVASVAVYVVACYGGPYAIFAYNCFFKPIAGSSSEKGSSSRQQDALESFYKGQAAIYDSTRAILLQGREEMMALAAAQLRLKNKREGFRKRVWVDIGGGTGWNIEQLDKHISVRDSFSDVYLVDFSPSLCAVARERFERLGWKNVHIVCMDARSFRLGPEDGTSERKADWITMSYSLSMIPDYYSVVDSLTNLLSPTGIISVADFYVQSSTNASFKNTYAGGIAGRGVNWFSRQFWRIWFEFDRVNLDEGRRDYLEYRFGTILSVNERNALLGGIPYYVWVGCPKATFPSSDILAKVDAAATNSPYLSPVRHEEARRDAVAAANTATALQVRSKGFEAAILNISVGLPLPSFFYQNHHFRIYYNELLSKHTQFNNSYIYAFTWEDARVDLRLLKLTSDDVVLAITSAGDNLLSYICDASPKRVHAVDLNPSQNHLLELKLACFSAALPYGDIWSIFSEGRHAGFRKLLLSTLSPHLSSQAFQFWLDRAAVFSSAGGLYETGQSGIALRATKWLFRVFGVAGDVRRMCEATTLNEQLEIWRTRVRPVILSWWVSWGIIGNERFLWKALGVPANQRNMILEDYFTRSGRTGAKDGGHAMWEYVVNTLDPVVEDSLLGKDNYFYLLCLLGRYTKSSHPAYLEPKNYKKLTASGAFSGVRIHTDEINEVLARLKPGTLTVAVVMDSMDWFDTDGVEARSQIRRLNASMKVGGRVLLRSAGLAPWYTKVFDEEGFSAKRVGTRTSGRCIDRVNMYASTWICTKRSDLVEEGRERKGSVEMLQL